VGTISDHHATDILIHKVSTYQIRPGSTGSAITQVFIVEVIHMNIKPIYTGWLSDI